MALVSYFSYTSIFHEVNDKNDKILIVSKNIYMNRVQQNTCFRHCKIDMFYRLDKKIDVLANINKF
jgi:hypothetical protein